MANDARIYYGHVRVATDTWPPHVWLESPYSRRNDATRLREVIGAGWWDPDAKVWRYPYEDWTEQDIEGWLKTLFPTARLKTRGGAGEVEVTDFGPPLAERLEPAEYPWRRKPYTHQRVTVAATRERNRILVLDEMGTGKTKSAIEAACLAIDEGDVERVVIICPTSLRETWAREIAQDAWHDPDDVAIVKHNPPAKSGQRLTGASDREYREWLLRKRSRWTVIHYPVVRRHVQDLQDLTRDQFLICDECLPGDALVLTEDGQRPIAELVEKHYRGLVGSHDGEEFVWRRMKGEWKRAERADWVELDVAADGEVRTLRATPDHPVFVVDDGWTKMQIVTPGAEVVVASWGRSRWAIGRVVRKFLLDGGREPTYDIEVEGDHCFFANGVLVHNSQKLKNRDAKVTKTVLTFEPAKSIWQTGTPVENSPEDVWTALHFADPELAGDFYPFRDRYCVVKNVTQGRAKFDLVVSARNLDELRGKLFTVSLRRRKEDVLTELPPKVRQRRLCEMGTKQAKAYRDMRDELKILFADKDDQWFRVEAANVRSRMIRLCQLADGYASPKPDTVGWFDDAGKLEALADVAEEVCSERKMIVWTRFTPPGRKFLELLDDYNPVRIAGEVPQDERQAAVDRFMQDDDCRVFVGQYHTAGLGLNLQAGSCVVLYDLWPNPAVVEQAVDRCHRSGQTLPVDVITLLSEDSIDEHVQRLCDRKEKWAGVVTGDADEGEIESGDIRWGKNDVMAVLED